ncbi:hypothetical protein B7696_00230 [Streptococcus mitis]|jgi:hypothetical protein|uniref:Uncharacterized protein n=1 Tax=Streptococcus mitis TaxID=28037 RepID=A0A1X1KP03_STRMT|nr:hypothetical protein [Streptococcus mitis]ORP01167.1 hypothetical protein B7696_00230 [Streptococcus mitis]
MNQEEEKERIFLELQAEIQAGLEAYERGECIPLEEVREHLLGSDSKALFDKLQEEVDRCVADMEKGNYFTKEELMKRYGLE